MFVSYNRQAATPSQEKGGKYILGMKVKLGDSVRKQALFENQKKKINTLSSKAPH